MTRPLLAVLFFLVFGSGTFAQHPFHDLNSGNELLGVLQECDEVRNLPAHTSLVETFVKFYDCGHAQGFIEEESTALHAAGQIGVIPGGVSLQQMVDVVKKYLIDHPEFRDKTSDLLVCAALYKVWPGKATAKGSPR
jgi:hypothetical protein